MLKTNYLKGYYLLPSGKLGKIESSAKYDDGSEYIFIKELGEMFDIKDIEISECIIDLLSIGQKYSQSMSVRHLYNFFCAIIKIIF